MRYSILISMFSLLFLLPCHADKIKFNKLTIYNGLTEKKVTENSERKLHVLAGSGILVVKNPQTTIEDIVSIEGNWNCILLEEYKDPDFFKYLFELVDGRILFKDSTKIISSKFIIEIDQYKNDNHKNYISIDYKDGNIEIPHLKIMPHNTDLEKVSVKSVDTHLHFYVWNDDISKFNNRFSNDVNAEIIIKNNDYIYEGSYGGYFENFLNMETSQVELKGHPIRGTITIPNIGTFEGVFDNCNCDIRQAMTKGTLKLIDGTILEGEFKGTELYNGKKILPDGDYFEGLFDVPSGKLLKGTMSTYIEGGKFEGYVENNKYEGSFYVSEKQKYWGARWMSSNESDVFCFENLISGKVFLEKENSYVNGELNNKKFTGIFRGTLSNDRHKGYFEGRFVDGYFVDGKVNADFDDSKYKGSIEGVFKEGNFVNGNIDAIVESDGVVETFKGIMKEGVFSGEYKKQTSNFNDYCFEGVVQDGVKSGIFKIIQSDCDLFIGKRSGYNEEIMDNDIFKGDWKNNKCIKGTLQFEIEGELYDGILTYSNNQYKISFKRNTKHFLTITLDANKYIEYSFMKIVLKKLYGSIINEQKKIKEETIRKEIARNRQMEKVRYEKCRKSSNEISNFIIGHNYVGESEKITGWTQMTKSKFRITFLEDGKVRIYVSSNVKVYHDHTPANMIGNLGGHFTSHNGGNDQLILSYTKELRGCDLVLKLSNGQEIVINDKYIVNYDGIKCTYDD